MIAPDRRRYYETLSQELEAQAQRIRHLIGSSHWLTDGQHKESLLRQLLAAHCPAGVRVGQGFVLFPDDESRCSREQDILLFDARYQMPLFMSGHTIVTFPSDVIAAISVKSTFRTDALRDTIDGLQTVPSSPPATSWRGGYFYTTETPKLQSCADQVARALAATADPNGPKVTLRVGSDVLVVCSVSSPSVRAYRCLQLSTAYFLARLLDHVAAFLGHPSSNFADTLDDSDTIVESCSAG